MTQNGLATISNPAAIGIADRYISPAVFRRYFFMFVFKRFIRSIQVSPATEKTYKRSLRQLYSFLEAKGAVFNPKTDDLLAYREHLSKKAATTQQNYIVAARKFFAWTASAGLYPNIAETIKSVKLDKAFRKDPLTTSQLGRVWEKTEAQTAQRVDHLAALRDHAIIKLLSTIGLRTIEVARANIEDVRTSGNNTVIFIQGKGHNEKDAPKPIEPGTEAAIREYLAARGETDPKAPLFASRKATKKGTDGKRNATEARMTTRSISRIAREALQGIANVNQKLTAHSFRHTVATQALRNGCTIMQVQQLLGHTNINTTMIYVHQIAAADNPCSQTIADAVKRARAGRD